MPKVWLEGLGGDCCHSLNQEIPEEEQIWRQKPFGVRQAENEASVGWAGRYESGHEKGKEYGTESHHHGQWWLRHTLV